MRLRTAFIKRETEELGVTIELVITLLADAKPLPSTISVETAQSRAFMKKMYNRTWKSRVPTLLHLWLHLANIEPKRKHILKVHDLSTLGHPWMQSTCLRLPQSIVRWIGSSTSLKTEYFKPTELIWGQINNIATFRALIHTNTKKHQMNPRHFCVLI